MTGHTACAEFLFDTANAESNPMHGLAGAMAVSEARPIITAPEFPPVAARCPHGNQFWTYPNAERIAALRDLNRGAQR